MRIRTYLGDGAYAEYRPSVGDYRIYTSDGDEETNEVFLESSAIIVLVNFVAKIKADLVNKKVGEP